MKRLLIALLFWASAAQSQSVSVKSGEHGAFTRLVLTYPKPVDWVLGRRANGYGVQIKGNSDPYDFSSVYQLITKDRLRSIWVDPTTGELQMGIDCYCHAIPFELDPRTLVIDIKDGPPPKNSSFELNLSDGRSAAPITAPPTRRPRTNPASGVSYDWLSPHVPRPEGQVTPANQHEDASHPVLPNRDVQRDAFRYLLVDQVGRGATAGVITMEHPKADQGQVSEQDRTTAPPRQARAALDELPGISVSAERNSKPDFTVQGEICPPDTELDFNGWAGSDDAATELSRARAFLLSEFDVPDAKMVLAAVNTHLYFGFGAEARLLLSSMLPRRQQDPFRMSLSYLVEGEQPPDNPFLNMQSCDSAASLWSVLATDSDTLLAHINGPAVSRTFLSLPQHLRAVLGPVTAMRLMKSGDGANAEVVKQSFERSVSPDNPAAALLEASQALQSGDPVGAEAALPTSKAAMDSLLLLVQARFDQRKAVEAKDLEALQAFAFEHGDGPLKPGLDRALAHAAALGNKFEAAFRYAAGQPDLERDIWLLLADVGSDAQLFDFAVGIDAAQRETLPSTLRSKVAERLVQAGLPNAAAGWASGKDIAADLAARVALYNHDARAALRLLSDRLSETDPELLASAYAALGDLDRAESAYRSAGKTAEADRLLRWSGTWPSASDEKSAPWNDVTALLDPVDSAAALPPLRAGQARVTQSTSTRQAIDALLAAVPMPAAEMP